jgi:hypothetical protein
MQTLIYLLDNVSVDKPYREQRDQKSAEHDRRGGKECSRKRESVERVRGVVEQWAGDRRTECASEASPALKDSEGRSLSMLM